MITNVYLKYILLCRYTFQDGSGLSIAEKIFADSCPANGLQWEYVGTETVVMHAQCTESMSMLYDMTKVNNLYDTTLDKNTMFQNVVQYLNN